MTKAEAWRRELEQRAWNDFQRHRGKVVMTGEGYGLNNAGVAGDMFFSPPIPVRIRHKQDTSDITRWVDGFLDPVWVADRLDDKGTLIIPALSYNGETGKMDERVNWKVLGWWDRVRLWCFGSQTR